MTMPNFLVIGAAKCGTDSLCDYLGQHPEVYMCPNKEPNFFVADGKAEIPYCGRGDREAIEQWDMWVSSLDRYQALFAGVSGEKAVGEGTTWYIYDETVPARIRHYIPEVKLIAILRNPADRAYSAYTMLLRDGRESIRDFAQALAVEGERIRDNWEPMWQYQRMGFYSSQLKRYYDTFDPAQIHVVVYDDFNARPSEVLRDLYRFLDVDDQFEPDTSERRNVSLVPKNHAYNRFIAGQNPLKAALRAVLPTDFRQRVKTSLLSRNLSKPPPLPPEIRQQLIETFRSDIIELQKQIDRDLSRWLQ
ncbi:MAG TPA: sulfotransferase [Ktedonobacterales bacterium]|jgi:hypothetical protein|nr:sulfotransferase [Ktedonobacterales bacterium]